MILTRRMTPQRLLRFAIPTVSVASIHTFVIFALYAYLDLEILRIPFLPVASIGTAVAFYVGFKNNSAYDRFWEGRKIWGGVVNSSRTWATYVMSYVLPGDASPEAEALRRALIYRHLAWINALRLQLRAKSRFFDKPHPTTKKRLEDHAEHMRNDWDKEVGPWLSPEEHSALGALKNTATHLVTRQGTHLAELYKEGRLDLFHQISMMEILQELYNLQGKCERIKNTPYPRLYAENSRIFTRVFCFLVPFGMLDVFADHIHGAVTTAETLAPVIPMILSSALVIWVFYTMESIGDATEDPFERSLSDVPMNALCRTIEIDLQQMLGETELSPPETAIDGILY
ncbi:MAG: hypothetical protein H6741_21615 [Alphaproteobacteria bacterium]|nr:hypothetical protein [Alphaproteobacteria bacterium]MCB9795310.1 hypothetical protein [Alphaproteobacteria bacterium]